MKSELYSELLAKISAGQLPPGRRLPSERELAQKHHCSLWAVHSAMNLLEEQGLVERRGVHGTFIAARVSLPEVQRLRNAGSRRVLVVVAKGIYLERLPIDKVISTLETRLSEAGLELIYGDLPKTSKGLAAFLETYQREELKALVLFPDYPEWQLLWSCAGLLDAFSGNLICFNRGLGDAGDLACHCLSADLRYEGRLAASHLLEHGARAIALFQAMRDSPWWLHQRVHGIRHILSATDRKLALHELPVEDRLGSYPRAAGFLRQHGRKAGIIAVNDEAAALLLDYLGTQGLQAGKDFSLISFDNAAAFRKYGLSSIELSIDRAGDILADAILNGALNAASHVHLNYQLSSRIIERGSVLPLPLA